MIAVDSVGFNDPEEFIVEFINKGVIVEKSGILELEGEYEDWDGVVILKLHFLAGCPSDV